MINKLTKYFLCFSTLLLTLFSGAVYPVLDIELTQGMDSAIPIAIMPFMGQESIASNDSNVPQVVGKDLQNSGRFRLADTSNLLPNLSKGAINYDYWRQQKVDDVVTGQVKSVGGGRYQVSFQLMGVFNKATLLDRQYTVSGTQLRALAHHISDLIYQQLTGDRGIFSTKIAYILVQRDAATHRAKYSLEVSDFDGYNPRTLLVSDQPLMSPSWSQDGRRIAYVSFEGNRASIYAQDVATGQRQLISKQPGINGAPAWSPDGRKMALVLSTTGYPKIYVLDLASNALTQITSDWYLDTEPSWAPDGRSLLFTSNRSGGPQVYRVYLDSKKVERVTYQGNYNARPSFTYDGKGIAVLHQDGSMFNVAYQNLETGKLVTLTRSGFDESPSIAPNGKMVVYATNYNGRGILAVVSVDGKVKLLLPAREGEVQEPAWSPFLDTQKN